MPRSERVLPRFPVFSILRFCAIRSMLTLGMMHWNCDAVTATRNSNDHAGVPIQYTYLLRYLGRYYYLLSSDWYAKQEPPEVSVGNNKNLSGCRHAPWLHLADSGYVDCIIPRVIQSTRCTCLDTGYDRQTEYSTRMYITVGRHTYT